MNKNKKYRIIAMILFIMVVVIKVYQFIILSYSINSINAFNNFNNRIYFIEITDPKQEIYSEKILLKDNIIKHFKFNNNKIIYCEWKNFYTEEKYQILYGDNALEFYNYDKITNSKNELINLPNVLSQNNFSFTDLMEIYYIIPTTYNNTKALKIKTKTEEIIIDKNTYLPICAYKIKINSKDSKKQKIKYSYKFEVGNVTDEDVALPDLTEYKVNN